MCACVCVLIRTAFFFSCSTIHTWYAYRCWASIFKRYYPFSQLYKTVDNRFVLFSKIEQTPLNPLNLNRIYWKKGALFHFGQSFCLIFGASILVFNFLESIFHPCIAHHLFFCWEQKTHDSFMNEILLLSRLSIHFEMNGCGDFGFWVYGFLGWPLMYVQHGPYKIRMKYLIWSGTLHDNWTMAWLTVWQWRTVSFGTAFYVNANSAAFINFVQRFATILLKLEMKRLSMNGKYSVGMKLKPPNSVDWKLLTLLNRLLFGCVCMGIFTRIRIRFDYKIPKL